MHSAMCEAQRSGGGVASSVLCGCREGRKKVQCEAEKVVWLLMDF